MEMLVQSQYIDNNNTTATLLPALPEAWTESGSINGVCIRGGYKIDMAWKKGRIVKLTVHDCRPDRSASAKLTLRQNNKKWTIRTKPGQSKRLL
jgi:alpha-L-fucosidase 2